MGKSLIQQARGRGGPAYIVRRKAYRYRISYPHLYVEGKAIVGRLLNSPAHSSPLAEIVVEIDNNIVYDESAEKRDKKIVKMNAIKIKQLSEEKSSEGEKSDIKVKRQKIKFIVPAAEGIVEGQQINMGFRHENKKIEIGDILKLKDIPQGTKIFNVEAVPGKGGKFLRSAGSSGIVMNKEKGKVEILIKRRKLIFHENARAIVGSASGDGRKLKPIVKAGKKYWMMKAIGRKWHRTSAVKMNAVDHPFGGGRGKRIKSKIAKRNAPAGAKVGHLRPRRTGRRK